VADAGIKNVIVKKELLGKVSSENGRVIRFRLVAEDKNRKSAWSQIFMINGQFVQVLPGNISIVGSIVLVNWSNGSAPADQTKYDIFVQYDSSTTMTHVGTSVGTSFSFLKTGNPQTLRVLVQLASLKSQAIVGTPTAGKTIKIFDSGIRNAVTGSLV
jgi:hypothetical protein